MGSVNKTANYGLNQWQGNEYPKRQDFADDNAKIDAQMKANADAIVDHATKASVHITQLACTKSGTVYALTGLTATAGIVSCVFKADATYAAGDRFLVMGMVFSVVTSGGEALRAGAFLSGDIVGVKLDIDNKILYIRQENAAQVGASNPNLLINGDFQVWQRGSSLSFNGNTLPNANVYLADRWIMFSATTASTLTAAQLSDGGIEISNPTAFSNANTRIGQHLGTVSETKNLFGKTATLSVCMRSSIANKKVGLKVGPFGNADVSNIGFGKEIQLTSDYKTYTVTGTIPTVYDTDYLSVGISLASNNSFTPDQNYLGLSGGTPFEVGTVDIAWAKLELGSVPTPISPRPYAEELLLCMRYHQQFTTREFGTGFCVATTQALFHIKYYVPLRTTPTGNYQTITAISYADTTGDHLVNQSSAKIEGYGTKFGIDLYVDNLTGLSIGSPCSCVGGDSDVLYTVDSEIY